MSYWNISSRFYDIGGNLFETSIYRPGESDVAFTVPKTGNTPVLMRHGGGDKNSMETTVIQGQELEIICYVERADIGVIEDLMESQYKEYVVDYESGGQLLFRGYLKPENISKRYETDPDWIEVRLVATDALADLKSIEFLDSDESVIEGHFTQLAIIKKALEKISDPGEMGFDFKIQLNTYEINLMASTECALDKIELNGEGFFEGDKDEENAMSCWDVIEAVLKPYNVFLKQYNGYYQITNPHELDSYVYTFDWATLTQQSRQAMDSIIPSNIIDITGYNYRPFIEHQKIHPLKHGYITFRNRQIGYDISDWDLEDWDTIWDIVGFTSETDSDDPTILRLTSTSQAPDDTEPYLELANNFYVEKLQSDEYISFQFRYELKTTSYSGEMPRLALKIEIKPPNGEWTDPLYVYLNLRLKGSTFWYTSSNSPEFKIEQSGNYNIRVSLWVGTATIDEAQLELRWPKIRRSTHTRTSSRTSSRTSTATNPGTTYGRRRSESTTVVRPPTTSTRRSGGPEELNPIETVQDRKYYLKQPNGYETFEAELDFADGENIGEAGALFVGETLTTEWSPYDSTTVAPLIAIYTQTVINNRQRFKNFLHTRIVDREHTIGFNNILKIEGLYYFIIDYVKDYRLGELEVGLIELVTDKLEFEPIEEVPVKSALVTDSEVPPLVSDGELQEGHGLVVGDVIRYDPDLLPKAGYVKAQADTPEHARAVGIVKSVITEDIFKYISDDYIRSDTKLYADLALEEGQYYFLSPTEPGKLVKSAELGPLDIEQCIGYTTSKGFKIEIDAKNMERPPYPGESDMSITGDGMEETPFTLVNDEEKPGNEKVYGTDGSGNKGWQDDRYVTGISFNAETQIITLTRKGKSNLQVSLELLAGMSIEGAGSSVFPFTLVNDEDEPGALYVYATNAEGVKGWWPLYSEADSGSGSDSESGSDLGSSALIPGLLEDVYVTQITFDTNTRILTLHRSQGMSDLTVEIPGGGEGTVETDKSITGDGSVESKIELVNDEESPGNNKVYGTDGVGAKGWKSDPAGTVESEMSVTGDGSSGNKIKLSGDETSPGNNKVYGTNAAGTKGWKNDPSGSDYRPIQVTGLTLLSTGWTLSGLYYYDLANVNITADMIVDVIPDNADISTVEDAVIMPHTDSSAGSVRIYAENEPADDIGVTINIFEKQT